MRKLAAATAVAVAISLLLVGCDTSGRPASDGRASSGSQASVSVPGHQLTIAAARQVSSTWLADVRNLEQHYSPAAAAQLMTGEALQSTVPVNGSSDLPASEPENQSFFIPVQASYPRWFVQTEQFPGEVFSTYMMAVFAQVAKDQPWKAALLSTNLESDPYRQMSQIARDSQGYATGLPVADSALAIAPAKLPATWANLYNSGITAADDSQVIQPNSIDYYRYLQDLCVRNGPSHGFVDSASQTPGNLPVYALALTGGGAEVIFTTINTVNYLATRTAAITSDFNLGSGVPEPPWFQHDFTVPAGTRMSQVTTFVLVATDPVRAKGHVEVIAAEQVQAIFSPATEYAATHGL